MAADSRILNCSLLCILILLYHCCLATHNTYWDSILESGNAVEDSTPGGYPNVNSDYFAHHQSVPYKYIS